MSIHKVISMNFYLESYALRKGKRNFKNIKKFWNDKRESISHVESILFLILVHTFSNGKNHEKAYYMKKSSHEYANS